MASRQMGKRHVRGPSSSGSDHRGATGRRRGIRWAAFLAIAAIVAVIFHGLAGERGPRGGRFGGRGDSLAEGGGKGAEASTSPRGAARARHVIPASLATPPLPRTHQALIDEMQQVSARLASAYADDPRVHDFRGRLCQYLGKSSEAEQAWRRCLELDDQRPDAWYGLAQLAMKRGEDAAAQPLLRRAREVDPGYPEVAGRLAELLMRDQQPEQAVRVLEEYLQRAPHSVDDWLKLGQIQQQLADHAEARISFERALQGEPNNRAALLGLGNVLMRLGERDKGVGYLQRSREVAPASESPKKKPAPEEFDITMTRATYASSAVYAAEILELHGRHDEAEWLYRRAIGVDPKNLSARQQLIRLLKRWGRLAEAVDVCRAAVAADPGNANLLWQLGVLQTQAGQFEAAEKTLRRVIELEPQRARGYAGLAEVYLESRRRLDEARRLAGQAINLEPAALHYVLLGRIHVQAGELRPAREALRKAVMLEPDNVAFQQLYRQLPGP